MRSCSRLMIPILTFLVTYSHAQYCIPTYQDACTSTGYINKFTFNTLSNSASGCNGNPDNYILYPATGNTTTAVQLGGSYTLTVKSNSQDGFGVWIDFNDDDDFADAGEFVYASPFFDNILFTGTVIIPNNASYIGQRRMRVRGGLETLLYDFDACSMLSNGETEDYEITIDPAPPCVNTPVAGTIKAFPSSICGEGNSSVIYLTGYSIASDISIQWESSPDGVNWVTLPGAHADIFITDPLYDTTWFRAQVTCENSGEFSFSNEIKITIGEVQILSVSNDTICGPGTATLEVNANADLVSWYENSSGGSPLFSGPSPFVFTPDITATTTYYASASSGVLYIDSIGLPDNSTGDGSDAYQNSYLVFNVDQPCSLIGVHVFPSSEGLVIIEWRDKFFTPVQTDTFTITASQVNEKIFLELNYELNAGSGFQLTLKEGSVPLFSNHAGVSYPYQVPGVISIKGSNLGPGYYFYYYDWIINYSDQCETPREPVTGVVNIAPALEVTTTPSNATICSNSGDSVMLIASPGYLNYTWAPAAGLSATTGTEVAAQPIVTTTYTLHADDSICQNEALVTVVIGNTPSVIVTATSDSICGGTSTQLLATATPLLNYKVEQISFNPDTAFGIPVLLEEDMVSAALPVGFPFKFYGYYYTSFKISANGFISFDTLVFDGCCAGQEVPDIFVPNNLIAFAWEDLSPQLGGTVSYKTIGTAPYRKLVIRFDSILHYGFTGGVDPVISQVVLFETTNNIEIHTTSMPGNPMGLWFTHTMGIENSTGTLGEAVPGRNGATGWTATNDAWRFAPIDYAYTWSPTSSLNNASVSNPVATPGITTLYTVTVLDTTSACFSESSIEIHVIDTPKAGVIDPYFVSFCEEGLDTLTLSGYPAGAAIQWQQSSSGSGPYIDIPGANGKTYITPLLTATSYYVAQVSCNNPGFTDASTIEVLPFPPPPSGDTVYRCGPGKVDLVATGTGGALLWYDDSTGGNYLGEGSPFTSDPISQSTTFWVQEGPAIAEPLSTTFIGGNLTYGNMFDITAAQTVLITGFDGHMGASQISDIEIFYKKGSFVGSENDPNAWTLAGTATNVIGQGVGIPTPYPILMNVAIPKGETFAFYVTSKTVTLDFTYGTVVGNVVASDDNIQIAEGNSISYPFGTYDQPVKWNGIIHYTIVGCSGERAPVQANLYYPEITASVSDSIICEGDTISLMAEDTGMGDFNYQWMPLIPVMIPSDGTGDTVLAAPSTTTAFTLTATEVSNSCDASMVVNIIVNPLPLTSFTGLSDTMYVIDDPVALVGDPPGGTFSGSGILGNIFDPGLAGAGGPYAITYSYTDANGCFDDTIQYVTVLLDVGVDESGSHAFIYIYPNPSDGYFFIDVRLPDLSTGMMIRVHDVFGRLVVKKNFAGSYLANEPLDLRKWPKGNYFLEVSAEGMMYRKKLLIQ